MLESLIACYSSQRPPLDALTMIEMPSMLRMQIVLFKALTLDQLDKACLNLQSNHILEIGLSVDSW
jgi:hypothetical protein